MERISEDEEGDPLRVIPAQLLTIEFFHTMDELKEKTLAQKKDRIVTALVLLTWLKAMQQVSYPLTKEQIEDLYLHASNRPDDPSIDQAYIESTKILLAIKKQFAVDAAEFGISKPIFLKLDVPGTTKEEAKEVWKHAFDAVYDSLNITDEKEQYDLYFSGLGYRELIVGDPETSFCIIVNQRDWTESFVWHEYLHTVYPGLENTFFDEMMTEALAYSHCHLADVSNYQLLFSKEEFLKRNVDVDYFDCLVYFFSLCRTHQTLFPTLRTFYENGNNERLSEIGAIIGPELFNTLCTVDPSKPERLSAALATLTK